MTLFETETINNEKPSEFQNIFDLNQQTEELIEQYQVKNSKSSVIEILKNPFYWHQVAKIIIGNLQDSENNATLLKWIEVSYYFIKTSFLCWQSSKKWKTTNPIKVF